ncbi:unnamed protein product, partial [Bemisia tabaci]
TAPCVLGLNPVKCVKYFLTSLQGQCIRGGEGLFNLYLGFSGVACFAMYRLLCHLNLSKRMDEQGVRSEHLNNRFFTIGLNGMTIDISQFTPRHCSAVVLD